MGRVVAAIALFVGSFSIALPASADATTTFSDSSDTRVSTSAEGADPQLHAVAGGAAGHRLVNGRAYNDAPRLARASASSGYYRLAQRMASGAESAAQGARLRTHLGQLEEYGRAGFRELPDGRMRYYDPLKPADKAGPMAGARRVREWDPSSDRMRTWFETLDHEGRVRIVRPETGGPKQHYMFDEYGNFTGDF